MEIKHTTPQGVKPIPNFPRRKSMPEILADMAVKLDRLDVIEKELKEIKAKQSATDAIPETPLMREILTERMKYQEKQQTEMEHERKQVHEALLKKIAENKIQFNVNPEENKIIDM